MDQRYMFEVTYRDKKRLMSSFSSEKREVWTAATLAARLTSPYFLIVSARGHTYDDAKTIQTAIKIEADALK
ncbi:hypothetical protein [Ruminococcus sp. XPD3002]|uniref:hypothetical protein n=1 Tax=Ruminococcus sp. XPD3002 TaxID=1452269 RepID=UPI000916CC90|nr:hypothetical protein SAMN04487832_11281 [Ruminococcus flavefaciens]